MGKEYVHQLRSNLNVSSVRVLLGSRTSPTITSAGTNAHLQRGWGEDYSMQYAVNSREVSAPVASKVA